MKFICDINSLKEAVINVQRAVSAKSTLPALEGILIETDANKINLTGYDLEIAIKTSVECNVADEGCVVFNAKIFSEIIRKLNGGNVTVTVDENLRATISSGNSEFSIIATDGVEFPELPKVKEGAKVLEFDSEMLASMVSQTIFAVSTDEERPVHTGILFEIENNQLSLVAVDGYRLAVRKENISFEGNMSFVVPSKTLNEIIKLMGEETKTVKFCVDERHSTFEIDNFLVVSRLLDGEFLDYKSAIPAGATTVILTSTKKLIDCVDRISLLITDRIKNPVRCTIENNNIFARCSTVLGKASDIVDCNMTGEPLEIGFNNKYFLDALRAVDSDTVKIEFNSPVSPIKILPTQGDNFLFLVVPVRLKAE